MTDDPFAAFREDAPDPFLGLTCDVPFVMTSVGQGPLPRLRGPARPVDRRDSQSGPPLLVPRVRVCPEGAGEADRAGPMIDRRRPAGAGTRQVRPPDRMLSFKRSREARGFSPNDRPATCERSKRYLGDFYDVVKRASIQSLADGRER